MGRPGHCYEWSPQFLWGVRREVKHLSTCRKGYSVSSGERKRIRLNRVRVIAVRCCAFGVVGLVVQPLTGLRRVIKCRAR